MTTPYSTQEERLDYLIGYLQREDPNWRRNVPAQWKHDKRQTVRALLNVRPPSPIDPEFIAVENAFLQTELGKKTITACTDIPLSSRYPQIGLWKGDITTLAIDAIVNAANNKLLGCFAPCHDCIDNAIHTAAGIQLRLECHEIMQHQQHDEPTGQAKITKGYNLPAKHVLHTVGPIIRDVVTREHAGLLASCYRSCYELAQMNRVESLAFCCISTGVFNFPREEAARIALATTLQCLQQAGSLNTIIFCLFSEEDYALYESLLT